MAPYAAAPNSARWVADDSTHCSSPDTFTSDDVGLRTLRAPRYVVAPQSRTGVQNAGVIRSGDLAARLGRDGFVVHCHDFLGLAAARGAQAAPMEPMVRMRLLPSADGPYHRH